MAVAVRRHAHRRQAELIHANSPRAGIVALLARVLGGPPVVVQVRDVLPGGAPAALVRSILRRGPAAVVAVSAYVAEQLAAAPRGQVRVIPNGLDLARFDGARGISRSEAREALGIDASASVLVVVAQLTPWKGQDDAVRILAQLHRSGVTAQLLVVGSAKFVAASTRFDNVAYEHELHRQVGELGLDAFVRFLGEREDVPRILRAADVALAPSWEEPFGRAVVEAMAMEVPVVATDRGGPAEILRDGAGGTVLPPRQPAAWTAEVERLLRSARLRERIGEEGRRRAEAAYTASAAAGAVVDLYREILTAG